METFGWDPAGCEGSADPFRRLALRGPLAKCHPRALPPAR